ncbi:MAG: YiiX/YebB-like N1pC/P60 family cysteine hydrolase, partial [Bradyrhizobium sp.]
MNWILDRVGRSIAAYLQKSAAGYEPFTPTDPAALRACIRPGDILLIEGRNHISGIIKYLTQSTWSHAALYVGPVAGIVSAEGEACDLVESNLDDGITCIPLSKYSQYHTRICRPVGLSADDCRAVCDYAVERIGLQYDLKNIIDLARYLVPVPVPQRWRRRMIALGSGDPTRLICSALIAQA